MGPERAAHALLLALTLVGCNRTNASESAAKPVAPTPAPPVAASTVFAHKLFRIELAPLPPCKPTSPCDVALVVHSLDGYKVNAEYPTKFVATPSPGVTVAGTGTFAVSAKDVGTMTIAVTAAQAGTARVMGAFKLSVCTDDVCEIAAPQIAFDVPVSAP
jgi:hypothetical protein